MAISFKVGPPRRVTAASGRLASARGSCSAADAASISRSSARRAFSCAWISERRPARKSRNVVMSKTVNEFLAISKAQDFLRLNLEK